MIGTLVRKELRDLSSSRSYWLMLLVTGVLVGHAFIDATTLYAEASGGGGGPSALSQGLNPLSGIVVPTLGAYDLVSTLLLPFVVIRVFAAERESGALALLLQAPVRFSSIIVAKALALLFGWLIALTPGLMALLWWRLIGGHLAAGETFAVLAGHVLRGVLTIGVGAAAGALATSAASAAIVALSVTLGAWAIDYAAAANGGWFRVLAQYTPETALRVFEQGEIRLSVVLVMLMVGATGLCVAWRWLQVGLSLQRRIAGAGTVLLLLVVLGFGASQLRMSRDVSEDRRNSFPAADEEALRSINSPLEITANLATEDPRLVDLERGVFAKLRRTVPDVQVSYVSRGRSGLFASAGDHYGEVWYELNGRREMSRSATEEIVLETIYRVAGIRPPTPQPGVSYPGFPLKRAPVDAGILFFLGWPLTVAFAAWWRQRLPRSLIPLRSS